MTTLTTLTTNGEIMAGTKKKRSDLEVLDAIDSDLIVGMLEHGKSIADVCLSLGISKRALDIWIRQTGFEPDILRARVHAAELLACETLTIADSIAEDNPSRPMHRIRTRQWLAERWDPKTYGTKPADLHINIGSLRLDALRQTTVLDAE
jgi:AraC-like DNA-binding protein|tara:strand:+ start:78 stop:527 length:450 start_codon:yes stop_codon:yes gene_type:complete